MNKRTAVWILGVAAFGAQSAMAADRCSFSAQRAAKVDESVSKVVIRAGAGDLEVRGDKKHKSVAAAGRACASTQALLDQIQIESRREGGTLYLKTILPDTSGLSSTNAQATLDLTVAVPETVTIEIDDTSGDLELSGVQAAVVTDGSGDVNIRDIRGEVVATDGSGDLHIDSVAGQVRVQDSSGDLEVSNVRGNIEVPTDSSGDMLLRSVAGNVHVGSDGSGDIVVEQVQKDVVIDTDSSGGIRVADVGGNFKVGSDSNGGIRHTRIAGTVQLPRSRHDRTEEI